MSKYRHSVTLQNPSIDTEDPNVQTWTTFGTRFVEIDETQGGELWRAQQLNPDVTTRITMRYDSGLDALTNASRVLWGDREYNVVSVINTKQQNKEVVLACKRN